MQLTLYTDYSLRVLVYLGVRDERQATIKEISVAYGISRNHLVKVVHNLGVTGYILTTRGKSGGIRLARPAREISIGDVVKTIEPSLKLVECFDRQTNTCPITAACGFKRIVLRARKAFLDVLDQYTLADILDNRIPLEVLLAERSDE